MCLMFMQACDILNAMNHLMMNLPRRVEKFTAPGAQVQATEVRIMTTKAKFGIAMGTVALALAAYGGYRYWEAPQAGPLALGSDQGRISLPATASNR